MEQPVEHARPRLLTLGVVALEDAAGTRIHCRRKVLLLLAYLARRVGRANSRDSLASLLWHDHDLTRARHSLRQVLAELRNVVPEGSLRIEREHVTLSAAGIWSDVAVLEAAARAGSARDAVHLIHGQFLEGVEVSGGEEWRAWIEAERRTVAAWVEKAFSGALSEVIARAAWAEALPLAERWQAVSEDPDGAPARAVVKIRSALSGSYAAQQPLRTLLVPDFVGRDREFGRLRAAWESAAAGRNSVVCIDGPRLAGVSRLVTEFAKTVAAADAWVLAPMLDRSVDVSALRAECRRLLADAPGLFGAAPDDLAALNAAVDERHTPETVAATGRQTGLLLGRILAAVAEEQPVLVVLDDVGAAGAGVEDVALGLALAQPPGVCVVLSCDSTHWALADARARLAKMVGHAQWLTLGALSAEETRELIASMAPVAATARDQLTDAVLADLGGLPGLAQAAVAALAADGRLAPGASGAWELTAPLDRPLEIPEEIRSRYRREWERLPDSARTVLAVSAVLGPQAALARVEALSRLPAPVFRDAVALLAAARYLRTSGVDDGIAAVSQEALRRVLADTFSPAERRALLAPPSAVPAPSRGHFLALMAASLLLVLGVAGFTRARAPALPPGTAVILADVRNASGDSTFDDALTVATTLSLAESQRIRLLRGGEIRDALRRAGREGDPAALTEARALELAEREGVPAVLSVSLDRVGADYRLTARLLKPGRDEPLRTEQVRVASREDVLAQLGELLVRVRRRMGEANGELATNAPSLPKVTTPSLQALRDYTQGTAAWTRRDYPAARAAFERAVALDSGFALAWASLSDYHYFVNDPQRGREALERAWERRDRLSERERLLLEARRATRLQGNADAIAVRRQLAERYPDRDNWYNLGNALMRDGQCESALPAYRRALRYDSLFTNAHINVATCFLIQRRLDSALVAYRRAEATDSTALRLGNIAEEYGRTLVLAGEDADAERHFLRMTAWGADGNRAAGHRQLAWLALARGQPREALRRVDLALALHGGEAASVSRFRDTNLRAQLLWELGRRDEARRTAEGAWRALPLARRDFGVLNRVSALPTPVLSAATWREIWQEMERLRGGWRGAVVEEAIGVVRARELLARGNPAGALALLEALPEDDEAVSLRFHSLRAEALAALGRREEALGAWQGAAQQIIRQSEWQPTWLRADLEVARMALGLGRYVEARAALERLEGRTVRGEPEAPFVREVRVLREALEGGGR